MKLLLRQVWSCLIEQVILTTFKKRSSQIQRISVSEHRTPDQVSLFRWKQCIGFDRRMRPQTFLSSGLTVLCTYLSLLHDHCNGFHRSFLGTRWWSQHLLLLSILEIRTCNAFHGIVEMHLRLEPAVLVSSNSSTSLVTEPRWPSSIIHLLWISRICFDFRDGRKFFGLITRGSCCAGFSATLQVFTPEWFLMAQLVDRRSLEMCGMYWVFSLCGRIGWWRRGSAYGGWRVGEQPWMRHVTHQMTKLLFWCTKMLANHAWSWAWAKPCALSVRCALWSNCTAQMCLVSGFPVYICRGTVERLEGVWPRGEVSVRVPLSAVLEEDEGFWVTSGSCAGCRSVTTTLSSWTVASTVLWCGRLGGQLWVPGLGRGHSGGHPSGAGGHWCPGWSQVNQVTSPLGKSIGHPGLGGGRSPWGRLCLRHYKHLFQWEKEYSENLRHQKYREQSHNEISVRHIWIADSRTIRWDSWSDSN